MACKREAKSWNSLNNKNISFSINPKSNHNILWFYENDCSVLSLNSKCESPTSSQDSGTWMCEQNECMIDPNLIETINQGPYYTWTASNYSEFWGRKLSDGILYRLGTLEPERAVRKGQAWHGFILIYLHLNIWGWNWMMLFRSGICLLSNTDTTRPLFPLHSTLEQNGVTLSSQLATRDGVGPTGLRLRQLLQVSYLHSISLSRYDWDDCWG